MSTLSPIILWADITFQCIFDPRPGAVITETREFSICINVTGGTTMESRLQVSMYPMLSYFSSSSLGDHFIVTSDKGTFLYSYVLLASIFQLQWLGEHW